MTEPLRPITPVRTLPQVLRQALTRDETDAPRVLLARVVSAPDNAHVRVDVAGTELVVPRLASYSAPAAGEPCYLLASGVYTIALGTVRR